MKLELSKKEKYLLALLVGIFNGLVMTFLDNTGIFSYELLFILPVTILSFVPLLFIFIDNLTFLNYSLTNYLLITSNSLTYIILISLKPNIAMQVVISYTPILIPVYLLTTLLAFFILIGYKKMIARKEWKKKLKYL